MRKKQKVCIQKDLNLLEQVHYQIEKFITYYDFVSAAHLLEQCQTAAVQIGGLIEDSEGEGTATVSLLEEYCEMLYQIHEEVMEKAGTRSSEGIKAYGRLHPLLEQIETSVKKDIKTRIEMLFLPYKASMWDSLESVWKAADEDPNCDAYVISIPYYDKNPDGSFGKMHYEGEEFPAYVPVTKYDSYDFEKRQPDVIFIHNPYDEQNLVTSVHPRFYSSNLKKYTECLVYIPYFILGENSSNNEKAAECIGDFCTVPGVKNADWVIVQSEDMKKNYVNNLVKDDGEGTKQYWNYKIVGLGSPKLDKIINARADDLLIPENWLKCINNLDGSSKKVVLYNTSVTAFLQYEEKLLEKIRVVFQVFQEYKNEVILLWRPHPLMKSTIKSMRPQLLKEYQQLVEDYKSEALGIYDETPDLHRAITISDGYYGDVSSSLVPLYKQTGKPVMFQEIGGQYNYDITNELLHSDIIAFGSRIIKYDLLQHDYLEYYEYCKIGRNDVHEKFVSVMDIEYGISWFLNAVYHLNEKKGTADYLLSFPEERYSPWQYKTPIRIGHKMIFTPNTSRCWAFYNLDTKIWSYENVPKEFYNESAQGTAFGNSILFDDHIIFCPGECNIFAKCNIYTLKITYYKKWLEQYKEITNDSAHANITSMLLYNDSLLVFSMQNNFIFEIEPEGLNIIRHFNIGSSKTGFQHVVRIPDTDSFYLIKKYTSHDTCWPEPIIKWNIITGKVEVYSDLPINLFLNSSLNAFSRLVFWKNTLYVIPLQGDAILKYDKKKNGFIRLKLNPEINFNVRKSKYYSWGAGRIYPYLAFNAERMTYMLQLPYDYSLADVDFEAESITNKRKWYVNGIKRLKSNRFSGYFKYPKEDVFFSVREFLELLILEDSLKIGDKKFNDRTDKINQTNNTAGKKIYSFILEQLKEIPC